MAAFKNYIDLMRLNKPIGILLLLWPTLIALWLAGAGHPSPDIVIIFVIGVVLMRSAGCIMNDIADRHVDGHVERTKLRPLASGKVSLTAAVLLFSILLALAFVLVLQLNWLTIQLAFIGAVLAIVYPFLKRITHLPQMGLGLAFSWGVPMAFAAELNSVPFAAWILFLAAAVWPMIYDTYYAMVDRADDIQVGIKSTAILFGRYDRLIIGGLQLLFLVLFSWVGYLFNLDWIYFASIGIAGLLFVYQQWITRTRAACFQAFLNNQWVGAVIFIGVVLSIS